MLTPRIEPGADRKLAADLRQRLSRTVDVHVDQVRISPETGAVEAEQIARAGDGVALRCVPHASVTGRSRTSR